MALVDRIMSKRTHDATEIFGRADADEPKLERVQKGVERYFQALLLPMGPTPAQR
jgi:hypothetical protein